MQMLQPSLAGRDYTLFGTPPGSAHGSHQARGGFRLTFSRPARASSPAEEDALYWDPCA